jgi:hypothetical protein
VTRSRQLLCIFLGLIAAGALLTTWSQNIAHFADGRGFPLQYLQDLKGTAAAKSFAVDLGFLLLACVAVMVAEARRLGVRFVWLYVLLSFAIAISVTFPLFLIARERRLARMEAAPTGVTLTAADWIGLALTSVAVLAMCGFILT